MKVRFMLLYFLLFLWNIPLDAFGKEGEELKNIQMRLKRYEVQPSDTLFLGENERYERAVRAEDLDGQARALQKMGQICYHLGLLAQSLQYHLKVEELSQNKLLSDSLRADNLNDLGMLFLVNSQPQEGKEAFKKALSIYQLKKNSNGIGTTYGNLGHLYEKTALYDSAFFYQHEAMKVFERVHNEDGIALIHENLGSIYEDQELYEQAYPHFSKALSRFQVNGNTSMLIDAYNNLGDIYRKKGNYKQALLYTKAAADLCMEVKANKQLSSTYRDLGKTYYFLKNVDSTFHYLELARQLYVEIYNEDSKNQAALLKVLYDIQQKDARIASMNREKRAATLIYLASAAVAGLLIVLAFVTIRNQRQRIRSERKLRDQEAALLGARQQLMESELKNKRLQEEQLKREVENKAKEITAHTLQAIEKNKLLEEMKYALTEIIRNDNRSYKKELRQLLNKINQSFHKDVSWGDFRRIFEEINQDFFTHLQQINPDLSASDLRLISLIKLNMNSPDIAALLGISADSLRVFRYRLRRKLGLEQGKSLTAFLQAI